MKRILLALAMVGLMGTVASAGPITVDYTLPGVAANIGCHDSLALAEWTSEFIIPKTSNPMGYLLSVNMMDTVASAATALDSLIISLYRKSQGVPDSTSTSANGSSWGTYNGFVKVYTFAGTEAYSHLFPLQKAIPQDSLQVYKMFPGIYKWCIVGGKGAGPHYIKAFKLRMMVESAENY